jgi:YVTN family beta-propeller protein
MEVFAMAYRSGRWLRLASSVGVVLTGLWMTNLAKAAASVTTVPGMPPVVNAGNLYSEAGVNRMSPAVAGALQRVYVPNLRSNDVYVIDPATLKVVDRFPVGLSPQHVVPSWDLQTLWVANNAEGRPDGSLTPIDPKTGKPGKAVMVDDPYNMYFTPDGKEAIVVAEARARLDFRDAHTMALKSNLDVPECKGINHADFSIDGKYALFTCEFGGKLAKIDLVNRKVVGYLQLEAKGMPQDIRISPDGKVFYVADMMADGVFVVDGDSFTKIGFIPTGVGTHGLYPSRDGTKRYISNRGSNLADSWRRESRYGQCQRGRQGAVAVGPLRRRGVRHRHRIRRRALDSSRHGAAWSDGVAAAGALFAGTYGEYALRSAGAHSCRARGYGFAWLRG